MDTGTISPDENETLRESLRVLVNAIPAAYLREAIQVLVWLSNEHHQELVSELIRASQEAEQLHLEPVDQ